MESLKMFCRQCEQTAGSKGCSKWGVCGKDPETAAWQDIIGHLARGIGYLAREIGKKEESDDRETDLLLREILFSTVTNVDFDPGRLAGLAEQAVKTRARLLEKAQSLGIEPEKRPGLEIEPPADGAGAIELAAGLREADKVSDEDIQSLRETLLYGLKGMAAYADHAGILGRENTQVNRFFHRALAALDEEKKADALLELVMETGRVNLECMKTLDEAHTSRFGHPTPTTVACGARKGPAIVVSGHDLLDLEQLLEQTAGRGINIYTHGEMLPAHGYPQLRKHDHLAGHYGTAWQNQQKEFSDLPGAVLMTTNCIQKPQENYRDHIFTTGLVAWPGVNHVGKSGGKKDFTPVINRALELGGFPEDRPDGETTVGFAHQAVLSVADKVIGAVKAGKIRHFFLVGGCDGARPGRNYYTELAEKIPGDCVILTLACGKFRFNRLEFGDIEGIPRMLDCGQCNDAYSAITIASALAGAFECGVNDLPLSLILSWYEQKAVVILLTLFALGIKNIRLGPTLPAFVSPGVLKVLSENFAVQPVTTPDEDLAAILS